MRAAIYDGTGGRDVIAMAHVPEPEAGPDDVLIEVAYAGLNRADVLERMGRYLAARGDRVIPGLEYSGIVCAAGARVEGLRPGMRVCGLVGGGAHAPFVAANALTVSPLPDEIGLREAAAIPEAFLTAYDALFAQGRFEFGDIVLIHAVGSSVGLAGIALVAAAGGTTIGTSRTPDKLERAKGHGLQHAVALDEGWSERVRGASGGTGVNIVLDFLGASALDGNLAALAIGGRIVQIGTLGGANAQLAMGSLMAKRASLVGTVLRSRPLDEKIALASALTTRILPSIARGALRPEIDRVLPLEQLADAHEVMENNANFGKILLAVNPSLEAA
ncbi:MAG: NAD(P)H-quinone oxidoreductase [Candidatus Eremiobacteraeota bacterium]|nr:NAD(P)H-quinone oxidoreductase [Candidatus Eremiobacteraeota bacterium]